MPPTTAPDRRGATLPPRSRRCRRGTALPLTLLAVSLAQASLLLSWRYLGAEAALLPDSTAALQLRRLVLACAMQPGVRWAELAAGGQTLAVAAGTEAPELSRSARRRAEIAPGSVLYSGQCAGPLPDGNSYRVRTGWLATADGRYRLTFVLPDAPP